MNDFIPDKFKAKRRERKATVVNRVLLNIAHSIYFLFRELPFEIREKISPTPYKFPFPDWLENAVFYQIYPQSFKDTNGDGIGDIAGIIEKLDYLEALGIDCIWLNPLFDSPFQDAGYDIRDFFKVADRYGTNDDLKKLFEKAREKNIRVVLDLVAGHSSDECQWFKDSARGELASNRDMYIWTRKKYAREPFFFVKSKHKREGYYRKNFYDCQPAFNYGYGIRMPFNKFEKDINDAAPLYTREKLKTVIEHWMELGASGFRVDLAESLVKRDPGYRKTIEVWNDIRDWMQKRWPDSVLISEWSFPEASIKAGFQIDFVLPTVFRGLPGLIFNSTGTIPYGHSYFGKKGKGNAQPFIKHFLDQYKRTRGKGLICLPTANHDYQRPACGGRTEVDELKALMLFSITWSDLPMIYYGDEIGVRYLENLINKEGSALNQFFNRAGQRTPMQWERSRQAGFSTANPEDFYLPIDDYTREGFPNVAEQDEDPDSLYNFTKNLIQIKKSCNAFSHRGELKIISGFDRNQYPLIYKRETGDESWLVIINPSDKKQGFQLPNDWKDFDYKNEVNKGIRIDEDAFVKCDRISYALLKVSN